MVNREILYFIGGVTVGALVSYYFTQKSLETKYDERADREIAEVKEHYKILHKKDYNSPSDYIRKNYSQAIDEYGLGEEAIEKLADYLGGAVPVPKEATEEPVHRNAFDLSEEQPEEDREDSEFVVPPLSHPYGDYEDPMDDPDWVVDYEKRSPEEPYIISEDEFSMERKEYDKVTLGYFTVDDTLCDENDVPIDDIERVVGRDALSNFGRYSRNPDIVYVRNEFLEIDYEIMRDEQSYEEVILGVRPTSKKTMRFKDEE